MDLSEPMWLRIKKPPRIISWEKVKPWRLICPGKKPWYSEGSSDFENTMVAVTGINFCPKPIHNREGVGWKGRKENWEREKEREKLILGNYQDNRDPLLEWNIREEKHFTSTFIQPWLLAPLAPEGFTGEAVPTQQILGSLGKETKIGGLIPKWGSNNSQQLKVAAFFIKYIGNIFWELRKVWGGE